MGRAETATYMLLALWVVWLTRVNLPLAPERAKLVAGPFLVAALWWLYRTVQGPVPPGDRGWGYKLVRALVTLTLLAPCAYMAFVTTMAVAYGHSTGTAAASIVVPALVGLTAWGLSKRGPLRPATGRMVMAAVGLWFALGWYPTLVVYWGPPSARRCEEAAYAPHVDRLSPEAWAAEASYPVAITPLVEDGHDVVLAAFGAGGRGLVRMMDDPASNRLAVLDVVDPSRPYATEVPLELQYARPLGLTAWAEEGHAAVLVEGYDSHSLQVFDLSDPLSPVPTGSQPVERRPAGLVDLPDARGYAMVAQNRLIQFHDAGSKDVVGDFRLRMEQSRLRPVVSVTRMEGSRKIYMGLIDGTLMELDSQPKSKADFLNADEDSYWAKNRVSRRRHERRLGRTGFGVGGLAASALLGQVVHVNQLNGDITFTHAGTLEVERVHRVDYSPSAVALDGRRGWLIVGDFRAGHVHVYDARTLEELTVTRREGETVTDPLPVGPGLFTFTYRELPGVLYVGSKCGVYQLDLAARLDAALGPDEQPLVAPEPPELPVPDEPAPTALPLQKRKFPSPEAPAPAPAADSAPQATAPPGDALAPGDAPAPAPVPAPANPTAAPPEPTAAPGMKVPTPAAPSPAAAPPAVPEPSAAGVREPEVAPAPEPAVPEPAVPEPAVPEPAVPEPAVPR